MYGGAIGYLLRYHEVTLFIFVIYQVLYVKFWVVI